MDYSGTSIYLNQRSGVAETPHLGPVPGSIPINNGQIVGYTSGITGTHVLGNHTNYAQDAYPNNISEHCHTQPLIRKEVEEGILSTVDTNLTSDPPPTEGNSDGSKEGIETQIKSEAEEDEAFVAAAHDILLHVRDEELTLEQAAESLERPYSYVNRRYQEFCDKDSVTKSEKKKRTVTKADGKKRRKKKRLKSVKSRRKLDGKIYYCEECPATFNRDSQLKTHTRVHLVENESHTCTACGVVFPKMTKLMQHRLSFHEEALQCPHCDAQFTNIPSYSHHLKTHNGDRPYKCKECGKGFHVKSTLVTHERIHTGERPYLCGYCGKTFITLSKLKQHYQTHTGEKPFECEECGNHFTTNGSLTEHMNIHLKEKPYACDECDARFNFKSGLRSHKLVHSGEPVKKPFKCKYCPAAFTLSSDLTRHTTVHTGDKPFKCDMCDFSCTRKTSFEYHQNIHMGKKPFKCDFYSCTMAYSRPQTLKFHKLKHGPPPPVACKICHENFPDRVAMKRHMMIHTGEKPYACNQCEQVCYDQADLKRHMFKHMYKPIKNNSKQIRPKKKFTQSKRPFIAETNTNNWPTNGYQVPEVVTNAQNAHGQHSTAAVTHYSWNTNAEDKNNQLAVQPSFNPFLASQYTNLASSIIDYRAPSMYLNQRNSVTEESHIGPIPDSIPINNGQMEVHTPRLTAIPESHMLGNQANYTHNTSSNNIAEHYYNQPPLRQEINEEEGICGEASNAIPDPPPPEGHNDRVEEGSETKVKSEAEEDEAFLKTAHDTFVQVKYKELRLEKAAEKLERPYSYVYRRYNEFCEKVIVIKPEKKKRVIIKANSKRKKRKIKRLRLGKSKPKLSGKIYQCEECPATFNRQYLFKVHANVHVEGNESHPCTECGEVFPKMSKLMLHRMSAHEEALQCPHCDAQFTNIRNYKYHIKVHNQGKPFKCDECGQSFIQKSSLQAHERIHTGEKPFMCGYCEKTFISLSGLKSHHHMHTGTREKPYECEDCGKRYPSQSSLHEHMNIHLATKPYACDECDARFNFKQNLRGHKLAHAGHIVEKNFKCTFCPAEFRLSTDLTRHTTVHTGDKPYKCDMCDFSCIRKTSYEYHRYIHTGEKPFKCDVYGCTMEYNRPQSLKMHKLKHGPPPSVECKVCHEKFTDNTAMKRHMMIHTGEKPYACDQCEQICYDQTSLKRHKFKHMYKPFEKPKQIRPKKKYTQPKQSVTAETTAKKWPTNEYHVPEVSFNAQSRLGQDSVTAPGHSAPSHYTWNTHAEDTNSQPAAQPAFNPFTASQYSNLVNNSWPSTVDPDDLRIRLLSTMNSTMNSFK